MRMVVVLALMVTPALADDSHEHESVVGKFYMDWKIPNKGEKRESSCCNDKDCYATPITYDPFQNKWFARRREDGKLIEIPPERFEQMQKDEQPSPDHQSHACIKPP